MHAITPDELTQYLKQSDIKPKFYKDVRLSVLTAFDASTHEFVALSDKTGDKGILLAQLEQRLFAVPYELSRRVVDTQTGRSKPIICDLCYTWQAGANAAKITFVRSSDKHSFTYLCCADLACSLHIRSMTKEAQLSRVHIREDLTTQQRIARLERNLIAIFERLHLTAVA